MRSALAWLARLAAGVALLALVVVAMLLVTAHTGWGREQLRLRVVDALRAAFPGGARVGALDGSLLGSLTLRDVELDRADGQPLVTAAAVRVDLALWPLVVHTARVHELVVDGPRAIVRTPAPETERSREAPSPWRIELQHVAILRGAVELDLGGARATVADLAATGTATIERGAIELFGWSHARWRERGADLTAMAAVALDGQGIRVPVAHAALDGSAITAHQLAIDLPARDPAPRDAGRGFDGALRGTLAVRTWGPALAALVPELGLSPEAAERLGDIFATADASAVAAPARSTQLEVLARTGAGRLWASLRGEPARLTARGVISVADIDLARWTRGRVCGGGGAIAALDGGWDRMRGTVIVNADLLGALDRFHRPGSSTLANPSPPCGSEEPAAQAAVIAIDATRDRATAIALAGGDDAAQVFAEASGHRAEASEHRAAGTIVLDRARAVARLQTIAVAGRRITGALAVDASASGTLGPALDVHVTGTAGGRTIAFDDLAIASARAPFELRVTDRGALGAARGAVATGVRSGRTPIGTIRADLENRADGTYRVAATSWPGGSGLALFADARVTLGDKAIVADIDRSRATLPGGVIWAGGGGSVTVTDATVALRGTTLHSGDATVALRGDLARGSGALTARADLDRVAVSRIDARYRGVASGALALARRRGAWSADGRFDLRGLTTAPPALASPASPAPVDASAHFILQNRRATLDVRATGAAFGSAELALEVTPPRDPFDLRAWQLLDRSAIHNATITARQLELAGVSALTPRPDGIESAGPLRGTLDGAVNLAPSALQGALAVRAIELPFGALDGDIVVEPRDGDLGARATARLSDVASADITARFALPGRPFDPVTWRQRGRDLLKDARAAVADIAFDPELLARLGIANALAAHGVEVPLRGRLTAALTLDAAAADARLAVEMNGVTGGSLVEPISQHIALTAGPRGTHAHATLQAGQLSLGDIDGEVAMTLDRWIDAPAQVLRAPLTAGWTLPETPALQVLALFGRRDLAGGALDASATVDGTLAAPVAKLHVGARDIAIVPPLGGRSPAVLRDLAADASWEAGTVQLAIAAHEAPGGELRATASGRLDALAAATGEITARQLDIAPFAALIPGIAPGLPGALMSAAGTVDGALALAAGRLAGALALTGGALPIGAEIGTLRDASASVAIDDRAITATVRGRLGRGTIDATAHAPVDLTSIDATVKVANVSPIAALRPIIDADIDARLRLGGARACGAVSASALVCGDIAIDNARIALPDRASARLLDATPPDDLVFVSPRAVATAVPRRSGDPAPARAPTHPWLVANVTLGTTPVVAEDVSEGVTFHASVRSDQLAVSLGDTLGVRGTIDVDHADADVLGRRYTVEPGALIFDGSSDPRLDLRLWHEFPELALAVALAGRASKPDLRLSSEPGGYTYDQLFGFLLGGEPGGDPGNQTRDAVAGAGARLITGRVGRQINKVLPFKLDAVSCGPETKATTATGGSCTFSKWLSERLLIAYRQHFGGAPEENVGDFQVQYRLGRKTLIDGAGRDRANFGADLLWRHRW